VAEIGADRILFGSDTPLYFTAMQRTRIDQAELSDHEKRLILRDNALRLLRLPEAA
jgi:predicted TIM-barrel fold metal-dependent hydrolase